MYTQCSHCKAIFEINMREITIAKGLLRCGECHQVFNASESMSTSMPKPYSTTVAESEKDQVDNATKVSHTGINSKTTKYSEDNKPTIRGIEKDSDGTRSLLKIIALFLVLFLLAQVLYNFKDEILGINRYEPEKIQMINHNVFMHPIEKGVLLISASMKNNANFDQKFPILEVRLNDSQNKLVALRRFTPSEYMENYDSSMLLKKNIVTTLKLKIKDPGNEATRFQFHFL